MDKIKFSVHPTFLIFAGVLIYFGKGKLFFIYLVVLLLHEFCHAIVAKRLGYSIKNIKIIPFGICLNMNSCEIRPRDEIKIALAGPVANLALCLVMVCLWWFVPSVYNFTNVFCYANLITGLFNLIPAFPLDGGRILLAIFRENTSEKKATRLCKIVNVFVCIILLCLFVFTCFYEINFTYLLVIFCIFSGIFESNTKQAYSMINFGLQKKVGKIVKVKSIYVSVDEKIFKICRYIDSFSYLQIFLYENKDKKVIANLFESDFLALVENFSANLTFRDVLKIN